MQSVRLSFAVFFLAATAVQAAAPRAPSCESDADCGANQYCALSDCAGSPCDPDDENCEPSDCGSGGGVCLDNDPGEPVEPTNCTSDADCSGADVCLTFERTSCSGGGSDPGAPGEEPGSGGGDDAAPPREPEEPECETESASICAPRWYADCDVDADCGAGFTCEFLDTSTCACTAPDGDDATDECSCEESTSDVGVCVLIDTPCTEDTDCGEDLFCTKYDEETPVAPCDAQTGEGCELDDGSDDNGPEGDEAQAPAEGFCAPLDYRNDDIGTEEPATGGEGEGEPPVNEGGEGEDTDDVPVEEAEYDDAIFCASTGGSPVGLVPFAALALVLRRRRR